MVAASSDLYPTNDESAQLLKIRYRYYVSQSTHNGVSDSKALRIPAREIETATIEALATAFDDPIALMARASIPLAPADLARIFSAAGTTAAAIRCRDPEMLRALVAKVIVHPTMLQIELVTTAMAKHLAVATSAEAEATLLLTCPTRMTRTSFWSRRSAGGRSFNVARSLFRNWHKPRGS
jgi:site-specific DNA recombinase